jgi:DNA invertase Pin-like site-specific DNA recombinase
LRKALAALGEGDTLVVSRIDRLARSTRDLLNVVFEVRERGAAFKSLAEAWVDTSSPMGEFMLTVLGGVATLERHLIKARTDIGIRGLARLASGSAARRS